MISILVIGKLKTENGGSGYVLNLPLRSLTESEIEVKRGFVFKNENPDRR
jgi:cytochrome oxidase assembly protein ShyY1